MPDLSALESRALQPDADALLANLRREGAPTRVHFAELFQDGQVRRAIAERYDLVPEGVEPGSQDFNRREYIAVQHFCGQDTVNVGLLGMQFPTFKQVTDDAATEMQRADGRGFQDEHEGPIMSWEDFEKYPWPDPDADGATVELEWYSENLPDDMCIIGGLTGHFCELLTWLMGYETLCYKLFDERDLVEAITERLIDIHSREVARMLEFDRVKMIWASDDMGYKTGPMISPDDMRKLVLRGHKTLAEMTHAAGRLYLLHSCGNLSTIIDDLVDDVRIDAKHSFEDTIEDVRDVKQTYGRRVALLGGIDMDFLCRADEQAIRARVRDTLDKCLPGGGYCLGTGNSVANYLPLENYLIMLDEGMRYGR